jgi:hypothetical protein
MQRLVMENIPSFIPPRIHAKNLGENKRATTSKYLEKELGIFTTACG